MAQFGPEAAQIFRITHVSNVPWILDHGLHCKSSPITDPNFVPIGMPELIQKRATRTVPIPPGGSLAEYVPFYFTPFSIMMLNIKSGRNGVIRRSNDEIAILVSTLHRIGEIGGRFVFTNGHAYMEETEYFDDMADLEKIDWPLLRARDFRRDPDDPGKVGRYQAEALVYQHVPVQALVGIACYNESVASKLTRDVSQRGLDLTIKAVRGWYF